MTTFRGDRGFRKQDASSDSGSYPRVPAETLTHGSIPEWQSPPDRPIPAESRNHVPLQCETWDSGCTSFRLRSIPSAADRAGWGEG